MPGYLHSSLWDKGLVSYVDAYGRRRNAHTIRGAAPGVAIGRPAAVRAGARPYHRNDIA
jgi:hypothetical protein